MLLHMFVKILFILLYLLLLFVLIRLLDISAWYESGFLIAQLVDPLSLSVQKLKILLDSRGLSYDDLVEKEELAELAESSGDITEGDLSLIEQKGKSETAPRQKKYEEFNDRAHFLEEVEDKKDSVWLIQVVPDVAAPLLSSSTWKSVTEKVSAVGIRTGVFICARDTRFCRLKGWQKPVVLLAMPEGQLHKDRVVMKQLFTSVRSTSVIAWVNKQLSAKLSNIKDSEELCKDWLDFKERDATSQADVRAIILPFQEKPSLLYTTLSMKYTGRIKFGVYHNPQGPVNCFELRPDSKTHLLIATSQGVHHYGHKKGEFLNAESLNLYFHTLGPEINDIFIISFVFVNIFCLMDLFFTSGGFAKIFLCFFWQLGKLNILFIVCWLPMQWLFQLSVFVPISNFFWWAVQCFCQTEIAGQLRQDWLMYSQHWYLTCALFCIYCFASGWCIKKYRPRSQEDALSSLEWIRMIFHQLNLFMIRPRSTWHQGQQISTSLEEGMDLFGSSVSPDRWLHPVITGEYVHNLPTWRYGGVNKPRPVDCWTLMCSTCQSSWETFSCSRSEYEMRQCFEESCRKLREILEDTLFKEGAQYWSGESKYCNIEGVFNKMTETRTNVENKIVTQQPQILTTNKVDDGNSNEPNFCEKCKGMINLMEQRRMYSKVMLKEPPRLDGNDIENERCETILDSTNREESLKPDSDNVFDVWPKDILETKECSICLEQYSPGSKICGLPCGHAFHFECVQVWLCGGKHCCPTCRWPAFKRKPSKLSKYKE